MADTFSGTVGRSSPERAASQQAPVRCVSEQAIVLQVIERVRLVRYKGFADFTLRIGPDAVLVGPNNAGKTTIVQALRLVASLLRYARRRNVSETFYDDVLDDQPRWVQGHPLNAIGKRELSWYKDENLRHEFRQDTTALEVTFKSKARLRVIWPPSGQPFFYIEKVPGLIARTPTVVAACTPSVGIVPTLGPVEHSEEVKSRDHVRENVGTRLTSRHFRNQMYHLRQDSPDHFGKFVAFALQHTPEITKIVLSDSYAAGSHQLDLYLTEAATHTEKEIYWVGDGLQVWFQVLLHTYQHQNADVLVLDEPDVFLHPDLQRRLVMMLDDREAQIILATHASEILTEASRDAVVWVDRTRRASRRAKDSATLTQLNQTLGSGFNLGMARALRSRVALFVEGDDIKMLRNIARAVGAMHVRGERGLAVIPLGGFTNWHQVEPFAWLSRDLLGDAVEIFVVLDRDYRSDALVYDLETTLATRSVKAHVWRRKELESYFLVAEAIARVTDLELVVAEEMLAEEVVKERLATQAAFISRRFRDAERGADVHTVNSTALADFDAAWADSQQRIGLVHPKEVIARMSERAQQSGARGLSARAISANIRAPEIPTEMVDLIHSIESALASPV